ncbi:NAD(P)-dependent oxidoreductase [Nocardia carnea]|uniref:NAD(P)-dependent oxidoreductase n=1 Tax=Nocardia carnea TaxID=37328 RepID=UPI002458C9C2|nr:NAD(P)-dependent oxidoreductase [Nocardia carnea]
MGTTDIGLIGLGKMGFAMAARLRDTGHRLVVFDARTEAIDRAVALGAAAAASPADVADRAETVLTSLPTPQVSLEVATGSEGIVHGARVRRVVELSTIGTHAARQLSELLAARGIALLDCPVSGGVTGARNGTLAIMASGPDDAFAATTALLESLGRPFLVAAEPGAGQTMKLINNLMAAATLAATAEVMVMGVKAGLDPAVMIDVLNAGSGATHASRDKFPRAVLPRTFDFGFATGLMTKDVQLYLREAETLGIPTELARTVARRWEETRDAQGPDSDFTSIVKPLEAAAGVIVGGGDDRRSP